MIPKAEEQRSILPHSIVKSRQTPLVHMDTMDSISKRRPEDIRSGTFINDILQKRLHFIQDIIIRTREVVRQNPAGLDVHQFLRANVVESLHGLGITVGLVPWISSPWIIAQWLKSRLQPGQRFGEWVREVALYPVDETGVLADGFDVDRGPSGPVGLGSVCEVEMDMW